jgi:hypothetical protein
MAPLDHDILKERARALRSAQLRHALHAAEVKWATFLRRFVLSVPKDSHAPLPCQGPAPSHP